MRQGGWRAGNTSRVIEWLSINDRRSSLERTIEGFQKFNDNKIKMTKMTKFKTWMLAAVAAACVWQAVGNVKRSTLLAFPHTSALGVNYPVSLQRVHNRRFLSQWRGIRNCATRHLTQEPRGMSLATWYSIVLLYNSSMAVVGSFCRYVYTDSDY